jgi:NAD(P)-dependent dehydrogenase (short-subunit alcohol dehydrogenase family)
MPSALPKKWRTSSPWTSDARYLRSLTIWRRVSRDQAALDAAVDEGMESFGGIDVVVANAAITLSPAKTWEITEEQRRDISGVDLTGLWHTVKATASSMVEARRAGQW